MSLENAVIGVLVRRKRTKEGWRLVRGPGINLKDPVVGTLVRRKRIKGGLASPSTSLPSHQWPVSSPKARTVEAEGAPHGPHDPTCVSFSS